MKTRRSQLDEAGDLHAPKGSRAWAIAVRDELSSALHDAEFSAGSVRDWWHAIREHEGWKSLEDDQGRTFRSFEAFCTHRKPLGLGHSPDDIEQIIRERKRAEAAAARAREVGALASVGRPSRSERNVDNVNITTRGGNDQDYLSRRLLRDHPDIFERLEQGEFPSVRAAAVAAGIVKKPTALDALKVAWRKAREGERQKFLAWIETEGN
jgi:hypothetical protein